MTFKKIGVISEAGTASSVNRNQIVRLGIRWWRNLQNRLLEISILSKQIPFFRWLFHVEKVWICDGAGIFEAKIQAAAAQQSKSSKKKTLANQGRVSISDSLKMHFCSHSNATIENPSIQV